MGNYDPDNEKLEIKKGDVWDFPDDTVGRIMIAAESMVLKDEFDTVEMLWALTDDLGETYPMARHKFDEPGNRGVLERIEGRSFPEQSVEDLKNNKFGSWSACPHCNASIVDAQSMVNVMKVVGKEYAVAFMAYGAAQAATGGAATLVWFCSNAITGISFTELMDKTRDPSDLRPDMWANLELVEIKDKKYLDRNDDPNKTYHHFICEECGDPAPMNPVVETTTSVENLKLHQ